jgi:hypothetical protein
MRKANGYSFFCHPPPDSREHAHIKKKNMIAKPKSWDFFLITFLTFATDSGRKLKAYCGPPGSNRGPPALDDVVPSFFLNPRCDV